MKKKSKKRVLLPNLPKRPKESTGYVIEKDIPLPEFDSKYPFGKMEVGDSFALSLGDRSRVTSVATRYSKTEDVKFTIRKVSDTEARCWRIK